MAYLITQRGSDNLENEIIASLRMPELVADLVQKMNSDIPRAEAERVADELVSDKRASYEGVVFHASEI